MDKTLTRLNAVYNIKELIIKALRDRFSQEPESSYYRFVADEFGHPDLEKTQIVITDVYTYDSKFLPALMIKNNGGQAFPISFNQNWMTKKYKWQQQYGEGEDGYGECLYVPEAYVWAGAWTGNFEVTIAAEDTITREELTDMVFITLQHLERQNLHDKGVFIKNCSTGGEVEEPWGNDYIYLQSINFETFSEWRREVPIGNNLIERIAYKRDEEGFGQRTGPTYRSGRFTCKHWIEFGISYDKASTCPPAPPSASTGEFNEIVRTPTLKVNV